MIPTCSFLPVCAYFLSRKQIGFKLLPFSGFMQRLNNMSRIRILSEQWWGFKGNLSKSEWPCLPSKWSKGLHWRRNRSWHKLSIKTTKLKIIYLKIKFQNLFAHCYSQGKWGFTPTCSELWEGVMVSNEISMELFWCPDLYFMNISGVLLDYQR